MVGLVNTSITCSKIKNIPYNLIFTTKFNEFEYVGDVRIPIQVIKYNQFFSRQISQSDCSNRIKLNYYIVTQTGGVMVVIVL